MLRKQSIRTPKWAVLLALVLLLATTALAAAQSPVLHLPLITGEGEAALVVPETPPYTAEEEPSLPTEPETPVEELDPNAPVGDSRDTNSGDYDAGSAQEEVSIAAFNATQWTVQNKVGIGTTAPTAPLDIAANVNDYTRIWVRNPNSGSNVQSQLYLNTSSSTNGLVLQQFGTGYAATWNGLSLKNMARLRTTPTVKGLILNTGGAYPLIFGTSDQERMRITPGGNVGIGTSAPAHKLSIGDGPYWTANGWGGAIDLPNASAIAWRPNNVGTGFGMGHTNGSFQFFHTTSAPGTTGSAATYDLTIDDIGRVGIGTTLPNGKLHVMGDTWIEDGDLLVRTGDIYVGGTQLNVPDYVFEPEYPLLSLDELRAYVAEEKHLPTLPNAEQIAQGGLNLGEFQMKLLEKTEELTLYTLAQDEQIKTLQQTTQAQDRQIETLQQDNETLQQENRAMQQMIADLETRLAALEEQE